MQNTSFTGLPKKERKEHQIESRGMDFHTTSSAHVMCDFGQIIWSLCGSVYLSVYLEFHHLPFVIHRDAAGANSIMHVKVLCKMKSH